MRRCAGFALVMVLSAVGLFGCGDEGLVVPGPISGEATVIPGTYALSTVEARVFDIAGVNLLALGAPPPQVRISALSGTPFVGGTAASIDLPAAVISSTLIQASGPLAAVTADFLATVTVLHPTGDQAAGSATFSVPTISGFTPATLQRDVPALFTITGTGFPTTVPVVSVVLDAQGGATPFAGGTAAQHVIFGVLVNSSTEISDTVNLSDLVGTATARVTVEFLGGTRVTAADLLDLDGGLVVTNLDDAGPGSLRNVLAAVDPGGLVLFDSALNGTILLASTLEIAQDVTIAGPGAATIQVSGQDSVRVCHVWSGVTATIAGLSIQNGFATDGAGVLAADATLVFRDCEFEANRAEQVHTVAAGATMGDVLARGAVLAMIDGSLTFERCALLNNTMSVTLDVGVAGVAGNLIVRGGILSCGAADVILREVTSSDDLTDVPVILATDAVLADVRIEGGLLYAGVGDLTIEDVTVERFTLDLGFGIATRTLVGDVTTVGGAFAAMTGAVAVRDLTSDDVSVTTRFSTVGGAAMVGEVEALGGLLYAGSGDVVLDQGNTEVALLVTSSVNPGTALGDLRARGGTVWSGGGALAVTDWQITASDVDVLVGGSAGSIGGVEALGAGFWTEAPSPTFEDCGFAQCELLVRGHLTTCYADDFVVRGAGLYCDSSDVTLTNCTFQDQVLKLDLDFNSFGLTRNAYAQGADVHAGAADVFLRGCASDAAGIDVDCHVNDRSVVQDVFGVGGLLFAAGGDVEVLDTAVSNPVLQIDVDVDFRAVVRDVLAGGAGGFVATPDAQFGRCRFAGLDMDCVLLCDQSAAVRNLVAVGGQVCALGDSARFEDCAFADNDLYLPATINDRSELVGLRTGGADLCLAAATSIVEDSTFDRADLGVVLGAADYSTTGDVNIHGGSIWIGNVSATLDRCTGGGNAFSADVSYITQAVGGDVRASGGVVYVDGGTTTMTSCALRSGTFAYEFLCSGSAPDFDTVGGGGCVATGAGAVEIHSSILDVALWRFDGTMVEKGGGGTGDWRVGGGVLFTDTGTLLADNCVLVCNQWVYAGEYDTQSTIDLTGAITGNMAYNRAGAHAFVAVTTSWAVASIGRATPGPGTITSEPDTSLQEFWP